MANHIAVSLDRRGAAEMSCIAGVGGDVRPLVRLAKSGRPIVAIDGCPLACARSCLARHGVAPSQHHVLRDFGVRKSPHESFDAVLAEQVREQIEKALLGLKPEGDS